VPDGIRDRARRAGNADLADPFDAERVDVRIVLLDQDRFERRHVGIHRNVVFGRESFADILGRAGLPQIEGRGTGGNPNPMETHGQSDYAMHAHGAVFAEVKVDPDLGQTRATRVVGAFAAGRIINPRLVKSQYFGGMIWGVSFALHEQAIMDPRSGRAHSSLAKAE
jgi:CO/xanthine dehydrogenase Mo-binding subunit